MMTEQNIQHGRNVQQAYGVEAQHAVNQQVSVKDILAALQDISFLPVNSASPTVVIRGSLITNPQISIFLKIFKDDAFDKKYITLRNEYIIYSELYNLRDMVVSPNLLARVGTFRLVPGAIDSEDGEYKADPKEFFLDDPILQTISNYDKYIYNTDSSHQIIPGGIARVDSLPDLETWTRTLCIMTCSVEHSLDDCIYDMAPTYKDIVGILYQIVHLLTWFEHIEMAHDDLHTGNIRVEHHAAPIDIYYQHKAGESVCVRTRFVVKIYDFDRSNIHKTTNMGNGVVIRQVLNSDYGFTVFNAKADCFKILRHIMQTFASQRIQALMGRLIPGFSNAATTIEEIYQSLPQHEELKCDRIVGEYDSCIHAYHLQAQVNNLLLGSFSDYFTELNEYHMITFPARETHSACSVYIPDSIMLTNLQMLDVLSLDISGGISVMPLQQARNSGQIVYPTPNVYYASRRP
jgi:hypothetical protein